MLVDQINSDLEELLSASHMLWLVRKSHNFHLLSADTRQINCVYNSSIAYWYVSVAKLE
jgi:hypothetical protein